MWPNKRFFLPTKGKKQTLQWHRFACYICCEAQGSIKHLKMCETHLKVPVVCCGKKILDSFVCLYPCHWAKGVKHVVVLLKTKHAILPQWHHCWRHREVKCHIQSIFVFATWISAWHWISVSLHKATENQDCKYCKKNLRKEKNKKTKKQYMSAGLWGCGSWENIEVMHQESIPSAHSLSWGPVLSVCVLSSDICHCSELLK